MITPVKSYSLQFVADGISESLVVDASLTPINENFNGAQPIAILVPVVTSAFTGALSGVTASIQGTIITFTFSTAPARLDNSSNLIVYTATFLLQYGT